MSTIVYPLKYDEPHEPGFTILPYKVIDHLIDQMPPLGFKIYVFVHRHTYGEGDPGRKIHLSKIVDFMDHMHDLNDIYDALIQMIDGPIPVLTEGADGGAVCFSLNLDLMIEVSDEGEVTVIG